MRFGSVCSGIEAASVAWSALGWEAAWFAETDKAANAVLAHRFPRVPNYGDMLLLAGKVRRREIEAPDVLVGGTPCQAFSVAGLRGGLSDARGQLTLAFIDLANAIDEVRIADGKPPVIIVWENVPGVLNHADNPLGCFLAGLAGNDDALEPGERPSEGRSSQFWTWHKKPRHHAPKWPVAGAVAGPERAVAWRVLDAQYFRLAQRRRRVFAVASARQGFDPARILFEFDGLRRDSAPRREAGEGVAGTLDARADGGGFPGTDGACSGHDVPAFRDTGVAKPLLSGGHSNNPLDENLVVEPTPIHFYHTNRQPEVGNSVDLAGPLKTDPSAVVYSVALRGREGGATAELGDDLAGCLRASGGGGDKPHVLAPVDVLPFDTTQITSAANYSHPKIGDPCHPLAAGAHPPAVCVTEPVTHTLKAEGFDASEDGTGRGQPIVPHEMAVRRLMPVECERLQGFPDNWTLVPSGHRGKPAADGPRYKQCGNSMATHVMAWIGRRIADHIDDRDVIDMLLGHNGGPALDPLAEVLG